MNTNTFLFDVQPYSRRRRSCVVQPRLSNLPEGVRNALDRLKDTLDSMPEEELRRRNMRHFPLRKAG
jgi:hypothetical protein